MAQILVYSSDGSLVFDTNGNDLSSVPAATLPLGTSDTILAIQNSQLVSIPNTMINSGSGSTTGIDISGDIICNDGCQIGGKAFQFYALYQQITLNIQIGFGISVSPGTDSIQLHTWTQQPNTDLTGRAYAGSVASTGGTISLSIDSSSQWISIFSRNPDNNNYYDGTCFVVNGNTITLVGFE